MVRFAPHMAEHLLVREAVPLGDEYRPGTDTYRLADEAEGGRPGRLPADASAHEASADAGAAPPTLADPTRAHVT